MYPDNKTISEMNVVGLGTQTSNFIGSQMIFV